MPAEDAARLRVAKKEWSKVKASHRRAARAAIRLGAPDAVEKIVQCSFDESSDRLSVILNLVQDAPSAVFWPVLAECWSMCNSTWAEQGRILALLKRHAHARAACLSGEFWDMLPSVISVYRGCSRPRALGLSWTTRIDIAEGFANGHRGIAVPDPVIASATVAKSSVLWATDDRDEGEILARPCEHQRASC